MKNYYHGTSYYSAYRILKEGFRLVNYFGRGGVKGEGIYVTDNLDYAYDMACSKGTPDTPNKPCLVQCEVKLANPIFWTKKEYDEKVIKYLKKEFDKRIVNRNYKVSKFIPKNKKLTKNEVINLVNYWGVQEEKEREKQRKKDPTSWWDCKGKGNTSYMENARFLLQRYNFSGWGQYTHDCWDSDEIVIFNPSEIKGIKVFEGIGKYNKEDVSYDDVKLGKEIDLNELKEGHDWNEKHIKELDKKWKDDSYSELYK